MELIRHPPYHERYCAFLDILGFRGLIERLEHGETPFDALKTLLAQVHNPEKGTDKSFYSEFRAQSLSDAVAISTVVNNVGLPQIFHAIETLALDLLSEGFFIRGAIVKGKLYHDDQMIFGAALVSAYELETEVVRYPRVMLTRAVVEDLKGYCEKGLSDEFLNRIRQSDDGPWHLHVLRKLEVASSNPNLIPNPKYRDLKFFEAIRSQIQRRFDESVDNPRHFEKVQWFASYWNRIDLPITGGLRQIVGPGITSQNFR
jgi:hypothetical protein